MLWFWPRNTLLGPGNAHAMLKCHQTLVGGPRCTQGSHIVDVMQQCSLFVSPFDVPRATNTIPTRHTSARQCFVVLGCGLATKSVVNVSGRHHDVPVVTGVNEHLCRKGSIGLATERYRCNGLWVHGIDLHGQQMAIQLNTVDPGLFQHVVETGIGHKGFWVRHLLVGIVAVVVNTIEQRKRACQASSFCLNTSVVECQISSGSHASYHSKGFKQSHRKIEGRGGDGGGDSGR